MTSKLNIIAYSFQSPLNQLGKYGWSATTTTIGGKSGSYDPDGVGKHHLRISNSVHCDFAVNYA